MELKPGLHRVHASELDAVVETAKSGGWTLLELDGRGVVDRKSFFEAARATFPMDPPLRGDRSWDALSDSLWSGIDSLPFRRILIVWRDSTKMASAADADYEIAAQVLNDVATSLANPDYTNGSPKEVSVVVDWA